MPNRSAVHIIALKREKEDSAVKQRSKTDFLVIGFALFSMFFGAGNVIFPPFLGMGSGPEWVTGFVCYYIADIGLALLALFAIFRYNGADQMLRPVGKLPATLLMCAIVLCIGPMLAIPRTAAMTFELSVEPLTQSINSVVFSLIFFVLILVCSIREKSVVDIVGKILTPLLLAGLLILIVKGLMMPLAPISDVAQFENVANEGIKAGYQTMDVLATMIFGVLILRSAESKGYLQHAEKRNVAIKASLVAGVLLLVVYGGLTYLGATVSSLNTIEVGRTQLLLSIMSGLLGQRGTVLFAIVVALACVTTAVGLVSSCSEYFSNLSNNRISYQTLVVVVCVFSAIVSNFGLDQIVSIAAPILDIVYPPALVMVALSFIPNLPYLAHRFAVAGAMVISVLTAIAVYGKVAIPVLGALPLASFGFGWVLPALVCGLVGVLVYHAFGKKTSSDAVAQKEEN